MQDSFWPSHIVGGLLQKGLKLALVELRKLQIVAEGAIAVNSTVYFLADPLTHLLSLFLLIMLLDLKYKLNPRSQHALYSHLLPFRRQALKTPWTS